MHWRAFMVFAWGLGVGLLGADPALDGPLPSARLTLGIPATQGAPLTTDVYFPGTTNALTPAAGRCPVIVLGHGFSQSKGQHVNQGRHLAMRGYIVLIPNSNPTLIEVAPGDFRAVWDSGTAETARTFISFGRLTLKA